ncbi:MAG: hypothetical protein M3Q78_02935 [Acidobacteriota bacterium]|nr:hypothetical protein [Acidobacteriota bacterium]
MKNIKPTNNIGIIALVVLIIFIVGYYSISRWSAASPSAPNIAAASNSNTAPTTSSDDGFSFLKFSERHFLIRTELVRSEYLKLSPACF